MLIVFLSEDERIEYYTSNPPSHLIENSLSPFSPSQHLTPSNQSPSSLTNPTLNIVREKYDKLRRRGPYSVRSKK